MTRGRAMFDLGTEWLTRNGVGFLLPSFRVMLASAAGPGSNDPLELDLLDASLDDGERWVRSELWRLRAGEELRRGNTAHGIELLERGIALAQGQGALLLVERSTATLTEVRS